MHIDLAMMDVGLGCEREKFIINGGVHQNDRIRIRCKIEIVTSSGAETAAQYQLLKGDASGGRVTEEEKKLLIITVNPATVPL